jgi:hypothetical protein
MIRVHAMYSHLSNGPDSFLMHWTRRTISSSLWQFGHAAASALGPTTPETLLATPNELIQ